MHLARREHPPQAKRTIPSVVPALQVGDAQQVRCASAQEQVVLDVSQRWALGLPGGAQQEQSCCVIKCFRSASVPHNWLNNPNHLRCRLDQCFRNGRISADGCHGNIRAVGTGAGLAWCPVPLREPVLLTCGGCLLVGHERVWWMTGHTRFALHEGIGLQLSHLLGVTCVACAQRRRGRDALCCDLAMAHGALDIIGAMRAAFPLGVCHLVAARTGFSGWNHLMVLLRGMNLLGNRRLDGGSQTKQNERDRAEQKCAESVHGQNLLRRIIAVSGR